ncbi:MAG TPA: hypothetical protein VH092_35585 [Urbifossiella sp.]|nr:hypothetical protein [Urbifossiella sp.]
MGTIATLTHSTFLRTCRRHLDQTEPGWREALRLNADRFRPG